MICCDEYLQQDDILPFEVICPHEKNTTKIILKKGVANKNYNAVCSKVEKHSVKVGYNNAPRFNVDDDKNMVREPYQIIKGGGGIRKGML